MFHTIFTTKLNSHPVFSLFSISVTGIVDRSLCLMSFSLFTRDSIYASAYMPRQFRPSVRLSVCHTRALWQNCWSKMEWLRCRALPLRQLGFLFHLCSLSVTHSLFQSRLRTVTLSVTYFLYKLFCWLQWLWTLHTIGLPVLIDFIFSTQPPDRFCRWTCFNRFLRATAYMLARIRHANSVCPTVCHTRALYRNGWTHHRNSFTVW